MKRAIYGLTIVAACGAPSAMPKNQSTAPATKRVSDSTLAVLEPIGGACVLRRIDPVAHTTIDLARLPTACVGARIAWRADLQRALVWFAPENRQTSGYAATGAPRPGHPDDDVEIVEHQYEVDLATHTVATIAPPKTADRLAELAYGADGSLLAFTEREFPKAKGVVTVEGHVLDFSQIQEGLPAAAISYRLAGTAWQIASVTVTTTGWDYARGWSAAPEATGIGPRSFAILEAHADTTEITDAGTKQSLDRIAPSQPDGWAKFTAAPIFVWMVTAEFTYTTGRIAWGGADGAFALLPELGFSGGELVSITSRGRYLLVAGSNAGAYPRLYDLAEHRRVYSSETARAVTFWPGTQY